MLRTKLERFLLLVDLFETDQERTDSHGVYIQTVGRLVCLFL